MKQKYRKPKPAKPWRTADKPDHVRDAVIILYTVVALGLIFMITNMDPLAAQIQAGNTMLFVNMIASVFCYGLCAYLAYKLSRQSYLARTLYFVVFAVRMPILIFTGTSLIEDNSGLCITEGFDFLLECICVWFLTRKDAIAWLRGDMDRELNGLSPLGAEARPTCAEAAAAVQELAAPKDGAVASEQSSAQAPEAAPMSNAQQAAQKPETGSAQ